jgi:thioester reductase-like protein
MRIFLTGSTGYLGSYLVSMLMAEYNAQLTLLVRAEDEDAAEKRLWKSLQLHMEFPEFIERVRSQVRIVTGDLTSPRFGLNEADYTQLVEETESIIHCAASLNRKSAKACFNVNLRGTLEMVKLAQAAHAHHGLRRFSDISTVAVAGHRSNEVVTEANSVEWARSDYDPYARTKKFCEHMVHELLPDVDVRVFRPSIILGDSRFPETTQFDMVRAFVWLAQLPVLPFDGTWRADIVPANYVARGVVNVHMKENPLYDTYHLSSGEDSLSYRKIVDALDGKRVKFLPRLEGSFTGLVDRLSNTPRGWGMAPAASLMKVFIPYLTFNTVFDNQRIVEELGGKPAPFSEYANGLRNFARNGKFTYAYKPWPESTEQRKVA